MKRQPRETQFVIELPQKDSGLQRWVSRVCRAPGSYWVTYDRSKARQMSGGVAEGALVQIGVRGAKVVQA